ncbi:TetR/AcrR family transcriptional regulator [Geodermatophilus aquaeductus]|uniref:Transcriptional regulator, TetR family n=1 Tax=Geodermatophilus aquaeductus TaxID=1564161 RepID=A0A521FNR4_9ACTN|nr:TetR/AcrR family transcriptional regulator [Geodermatophilus aquaeductus]SMO97802.1 transcriptional regulator, TetR family [Geodermatophilus aquaeductus]
MSESATPVRLLDAAEELLAVSGPAGTSVRDVLRRAGVGNAAAVGYYFGDKDGLVAAVERRVVDGVVADRARALQGLGEDAGVEALVDGWVRPIVALRCAGRGRYAARVFTRIFDQPPSRWEANGAAAVRAMAGRYCTALAPLLPHLDDVELAWRWQCVTATTDFYAIGALDFGQPAPGPDDVDPHVRRLVVPGSALLRAEPTG